MKHFNTISKAICAFIVLAISNINIATAQCASPDLVFKNPRLFSGTAGNKGAIYFFDEVATGIDAYITIIDKVGGASLVEIDDTDNGYGAAWQPIVNGPSSPANNISYINWKIEFRSKMLGTPYIFPCFTLSAIDVDGDNARIREFVEAKGLINFSTKTGTSLTVTSGGDSTRGLGALAVKTGIDTSAWDTNINFNYLALTTVYVKTGAKVQGTSGSAATERLNCIFFSRIGNLPSASIAPLPVKYSSFDASVNDKTVTLNWLTEQESNNSHFEVERSFDRTNFNTIGLVMDALTTAGSTKGYKYKDNAAELQGKTVAYYRLKQIDNNGKVNYSTIIAVRLQSAKNGVVMQVSPNPFTEKLTVRFDAADAGAVEIRIVNMSGQTIVSKQTIIGKGYNNLQVEGLNKLTNGMYVAQVFVNGVIVDKQKVMKN